MPERLDDPQRFVDDLTVVEAVNLAGLIGNQLLTEATAASLAEAPLGSTKGRQVLAESALSHPDDEMILLMERFLDEANASIERIDSKVEKTIVLLENKSKEL